MANLTEFSGIGVDDCKRRAGNTNTRT